MTASVIVQKTSGCVGQVAVQRSCKVCHCGVMPYDLRRPAYNMTFKRRRRACSQHCSRYSPGATGQIFHSIKQFKLKFD